jgi:hypothetical protein
VGLKDQDATLLLAGAEILSVQGFKGLNTQRVSGLDPNYGTRSKYDCDLLKLAEIKQPLNPWPRPGMQGCGGGNPIP